MVYVCVLISGVALTFAFDQLETVLAREHEQIQNMKACGLTDDEIDDLGKSGKYEEQMRFYSEEDDDENKND